MKNIWIPVELDHPEQQRKTVVYGAKLAAELNMGLLFTFISNSNTYGYAAAWSMAEASTHFNPDRLINEQEEEIEKILMDYREEINALTDPPSGVNFQILNRIHAEKLINAPEKSKIALIIICKDNIIDRPFFSSYNINEQMLKDSHTPVLIHPPEKKFTKVNRILFGTNFHPFDIVVLNKISILFDKHKTEISVLHITEDLKFEEKLKQAGYLKTIKSKIHNKNLHVDTMVTNGKSSIPNHLRSFAIDRDADIIAVLNRRTNFLEGVIQPSVTDELITTSELPLMVFSLA
jgi:nucleotide-binding universal stress UspA family protein